jgi:hypothetical protein
MSVRDRFKDAMTNSLALAEPGEHIDALKLGDEAIAEAIREPDVLRIRTLCHHAAIETRFAENGHPLNAITSNLSPRTPKMPELCTEWQQ